MSEKVVNYTPEQTATMLEQYTASPNAETVKAIAESLGKSVRSVVAKLVREKVYQKPQYTTKTGEKPVHKPALADAIGSVLNLTEQEASSLEGATKTALQKIFMALANSKPL